MEGHSVTRTLLVGSQAQSVVLIHKQMLGDVDMSPGWSLISYKCQLSKAKRA